MLTLWSFARKHLRKGMKKMKSIPLEKITVLGGLAHRLLLNSVRLESDIYMPDAVCRLDSGGWPADAEGRPAGSLHICARFCGRFTEISTKKGISGKSFPKDSSTNSSFRVITGFSGRCSSISV